MLKFGNKEFRNLEEQVEKNKEDIQNLAAGISAVMGFMPTVKGVYATADQIPEGSYNTGDTFLIGSSTPYAVYIYTANDTWQNVGDMAIYKHISSTPSTTYPTSRFVEKYNELQLASFSCYYDFKYMSWLKRIKMERLKLSFNMSDVFHISTVKTERGLNYPYARSFSFSLAATF